MGVEWIVNKFFKVHSYYSLFEPWRDWYVFSPNVFSSDPIVFDWHKIEEACTILGLSDMPDIEVDDGEDYYAYTQYICGSPASIQVNARLSPLAASVGLAHELKHCADHQERNYEPPKVDGAIISISPSVLGWKTYWYHPTELGAREFEPYGLENMLVKEIL